jgi:hypothetical protein
MKISDRTQIGFKTLNTCLDCKHCKMTLTKFGVGVYHCTAFEPEPVQDTTILDETERFFKFNAAYAQWHLDNVVHANTVCMFLNKKI